MTVEEQMLMNTLSKECERLHKELQVAEKHIDYLKEDKNQLYTRCDETARDAFLKGMYGSIRITSISEFVRLHKELQRHKWIPLTKRPMTEEEKKILKDEEAFNCQLPEDRQEILITVDGKTTSDIFYWDDGYCFMEHKYIDDVIAWMPLPEPYQKGETE